MMPYTLALLLFTALGVAAGFLHARAQHRYGGAVRLPLDRILQQPGKDESGGVPSSIIEPAEETSGVHRG